MRRNDPYGNKQRAKTMFVFLVFILISYIFAYFLESWGFAAVSTIGWILICWVSVTMSFKGA